MTKRNRIKKICVNNQTITSETTLDALPRPKKQHKEKSKIKKQREAIIQMLKMQEQSKEKQM